MTTYVIRAQDQNLVVTLTSEDCRGLWAALQPELENHAPVRGIVLDCGEVAFIDSLNIAAIIAVRNRVTAAGQKFAVANLRPAIQAVFTVLKLDRMFALDQNLASALTNLASA